MSALPKPTSEPRFDAQDASSFVTNQADTFLSWLSAQPGLGAFVVAKSDGLLTVTFSDGLRLTLIATLPDDLTRDRTHGAFTGC